MFRWWKVFHNHRVMNEERLPLRFLLLGDGSLRSAWLQRLWPWRLCLQRVPRPIRPAQRPHLRFELLEDRTLCSADRFDTLLPNDIRDSAAAIGAAPGIHLDQLSIAPAGDQDWYRFELLRPDSIDFRLVFQRVNGELSFSVMDASGVLLGTAGQTADGLALTLNDLPAGAYYVHASGDPGVMNTYSLDITPASSSSTRVLYVNDADTSNDFYTRTVGDLLFNGLSPEQPMASVQQVLDTYAIGPTDLIVVDTGSYAGPIIISPASSGAAYAGSPGGSVFNGGGIEVNGADGNLFYGLSFFGSDGVGISLTDASDNLLRHNSFTGMVAAIRIAGGAGNVVQDNAILGSITPDVESQGIALSAGAIALVRGNLISGWTYGILSLSSDAVISGNTVYNNEIGLAGSGSFGGASWAEGQPNDVYDNVVGIHAYDAASVAFNRIHGNATGIQADSEASVHHNVIFRNGLGILIDGADAVALSNNTIYTALGDGVRVGNGSSNTALRNNIIWTEDGYDLYVANDSQAGFDSDYNNLFSTGAGKIAFWQKDFTDLFDWQVEANLDRHSIGYTPLDPSLDDPLFRDLAGDDYHLTDLVSTSIDAGDPASVFDFEVGVNGGRIDLGAYGNTAEAAQSRSAYVKIDSPTFYTDWEAGLTHDIVWHTYDALSEDHHLAGNVIIDLYREGGGLVRSLATVPAANGSFSWTPSKSGITGDSRQRYRLQIRSASDDTITDTAREAFAVPSPGSNYYVNDDSVLNNQYTSAPGSNRNTGKTAADPKADLLAVLGAYDLDRKETVFIDTGDYLEVRNVVITGSDSEFTITGPTATGKTAVLDRGNTAAGAAAIEVNDGDFITLKFLTLTGAETGLWVHNGSSTFNGSHLTAAWNTAEGFRIESDTPFKISDSLANNNRFGFFLTGSGGGRLEKSLAFANEISVSVSNTGTNPTIIGNADLRQGKGNKIYDNSQMGIRAVGNVQIVGNTVYGQSATGSTGVMLESANAKAVVRNNVVFDNYDGIALMLSGIVEGNRVYHNTRYGIVSNGTATIRNNVVYNNDVGIFASGAGGFAGTITNNLVYANLTAGIIIFDALGGAQLTNNTVYQPVGDAVSVQANSQDVNLRGNILWVHSGYCINVASDSQIGFVSDYNAYVAGDGNIALWGGVTQATLVNWRSASDTDGASLALLDPWFDEPEGSDGVLGYGEGQDGRDDNFSRPTPYGSFHAILLAPVVNAGTGLPIMLTWNNDQRSVSFIERSSSSKSNDTSSAGFVSAYLSLSSDLKMFFTSAAETTKLEVTAGGNVEADIPSVENIQEELIVAEETREDGLSEANDKAEDAIEAARLLQAAEPGLNAGREFLVGQAAPASVLSPLDGAEAAFLALLAAPADETNAVNNPTVVTQPNSTLVSDLAVSADTETVSPANVSDTSATTVVSASSTPDWTAPFVFCFVIYTIHALSPSYTREPERRPVVGGTPQAGI